MSAAVSPRRKHGSLLVSDTLVAKRQAAEKRFRLYGISAIGIGIFFLITLLSSIISNGSGAFTQTFISLEITLDPATVAKAEKSLLKTSGYRKLLEKSVYNQVRTRGIETPLKKPRDMRALFSDGAAGKLRSLVQERPELIGQTISHTVLASSRVDGYMKGRVSRESIAKDKNINAFQLDLVDELVNARVITKSFNLGFVTGSDSSDSRPEQSGMGQSMIGSLAMMLVVLAVCLPISVAASIYLEEFAPKNKITDFIEVNISNLAAVPSIVYGILALAAFIQFMGMPRSAPLVGGLALSLMTLPTIIIATRASLKAVPASIRDAALGVGASRMQAVFHHVLPLAMPGILTGTIIGLAAALGETAPLLMIGMVAFVQSSISINPDSLFLDPNVGMPAQIYIWATRADGAWYERAWGGIIMLLGFLILMNTIAVILRRRFERRW